MEIRHFIILTAFNLAAFFTFLNWRARNITVRAKNAAIAFLWFQKRFTFRTFKEKLTGIFGHLNGFLMVTHRTSDG
jgi:hypothetical protein